MADVESFIDPRARLTQRSIAFGWFPQRSAIATSINEGFEGLRLLVISQSVEVLSPGAHHCSAFIQLHCLVVSRAHGVPLTVRKLQLDELSIPPLLIQQRAGRRPESMPRHLIAEVTHSAQCRRHGVL